MGLDCLLQKHKGSKINVGYSLNLSSFCKDLSFVMDIPRSKH